MAGKSLSIHKSKGKIVQIQDKRLHEFVIRCKVSCDNGY